MSVRYLLWRARLELTVVVLRAVTLAQSLPSIARWSEPSPSNPQRKGAV